MSKAKKYTKQEQRDWEEFGLACLTTGINENSFHGMGDVFQEYKAYLAWKAEGEK